jgi:hypothetical protein
MNAQLERREGDDISAMANRLLAKVGGRVLRSAKNYGPRAQGGGA